MAKEKAKEVKEVVIEIEEVVTEEVKSLEVKPPEESLSPTTREAVNTLDTFNNMDDMLSFARVLVEGNLVPFGTPEQVATIVLQGRELGLPPVTSLYNLYFIENKPTLSVHCIGGLLRKEGIVWKVIKDAEKSKVAEGKVDIVTTVRFYYNATIGKGKTAKVITMEQDSTFTWTDAVKAELIDKNNWKKHPKAMLYSRAFTLGARRVAPHILMGLMETTEMADSTGIEYTVDEEGNLVK